MPALDGVRGLAILMVFAVHFVGDTIPQSRLEAAVQHACTFGVFGVDLFFVLSGFLITGILIEGRDDEGYFRNFYMRRTLRIFPLYYGVLVLLFVVAPAIPLFRSPALDAMRHDQLWAWLYGMNVLAAIRGALAGSYIDHFWSLAVEEHFYLVWPAIVWLCPPRKLPTVAAAVAATSLAARIVLADRVNPVAIYTLTPFRLDALCFGGFLAAVARQRGLAAIGRAMRPALAVAAVIFAICSVLIRMDRTLAPALRELRVASFVGALGLLVLAPLVLPARSALNRFFTSGWMRFLGKYSYGLYVFHHFVAMYYIRNHTELPLARALGSHPLAVAVQATAGAALSIAVAYASYHGYERHFIAMKRYWAPRPAVRPAVSGVAIASEAND
jgi:peptidoglycan/LPS O-acetylase OafA/YrhL